MSHTPTEVAADVLRLVLAELTRDEDAFTATLSELEGRPEQQHIDTIKLLIGLTGSLWTSARGPAAITDVQHRIAELLDFNAHIREDRP